MTAQACSVWQVNMIVVDIFMLYVMAEFQSIRFLPIYDRRCETGFSTISP